MTANLNPMNKDIKRMPECGNTRCIDGVLYDLIGQIAGICKKCEKVELMMGSNEDFVIYHRNGRPVGYEYVGPGDVREIIKSVNNQ